MTIENYITVSLHPTYLEFSVELHVSTEEIIENPSMMVLSENHGPWTTEKSQPGEARSRCRSHELRGERR